MKKRIISLVITLFIITFVGGTLADTGFKNEIEKFLNENGYIIGGNSTSSITEDGINIESIPIQKTQIPALSMYNTDSSNLINSVSESALFILEKNGDKKYFIAEIGKQENISILKMYDENGGIVIDITNQKIISVIGNEKDCSRWVCIWDYILKQIKDKGLIIAALCSSCALEPTKASCVLCLKEVGILAAKGIWDCGWNKCSWYKCKKNCENLHAFGDFVNYCSNGELWKQRAHFSYQCPEGIDYGESGTCEIDNSSAEWISAIKVMSCPYGCENGICKGSPVCSVETPKNNIVSTTKRILFQISSLNKLKSIQIIDYSDKRPRWRRWCSRCKLNYSTKKTLKEGVHNITIRCTDYENKTSEYSLSFRIDSTNN